MYSTRNCKYGLHSFGMDLNVNQIVYKLLETNISIVQLLFLQLLCAWSL